MLEILNKAFTEIKRHQGETFVICCDGEVLKNQDLLKAFCEDIVCLKNAGIKIILVHDGENIVDSMLEKFSIQIPAANSKEVKQTSPELVEMILSGHVNKNIVTQINLAGGSAIGISGKDAHFLMSRRSKIARYSGDSNSKIINFGFSGELSFVNPDILLIAEENDIIPVISPITLGEDNRTYKINCEDIAGAMAAVLSASKIIFISDCEGISDTKGNIIEEIQLNKINANKLKEPSLSEKINAIHICFGQTTESAHIIDGKTPHSLLTTIFSDKSNGTCILV